MDGLLPSTANGNTKVLNSSYGNCMPTTAVIGQHRPYEAVPSLDAFHLGHHGAQSASPLDPNVVSYGNESLYQPYQLHHHQGQGQHHNSNNTPSYYEPQQHQGHPNQHSLSSQMSAMSLGPGGDGSSIPMQQQPQRKNAIFASENVASVAVSKMMQLSQSRSGQVTASSGVHGRHLPTGQILDGPDMNSVGNNNIPQHPQHPHHHHQQQQHQQHHQIHHQQHHPQQQQSCPPPSLGGLGTNNSTVNNSINANSNAHPGDPNLNAGFFVSDYIKEEILKRLVKSQELPSEAAALELPPRVDVYIELQPVEPSPGAASYTFNGMPSSVYRATNSETGGLYCLRRFHAFTPSTANAKLLMGTIEAWKRLTHANIAPLRQVFTTKAFGDASVIFVYDYYPASETLMAAYFANQQLPAPLALVGGTLGGANSHNGGVNGPGGPASSQNPQAQQMLSTNGYSTASRPYSQQAQASRKLLPEATIWNYIIQISSALRTIHQAQLACRALDPTKILLTSGWSTNANNGFSNRGRNARLRIAFAGVPDILTLDAFLQHQQQQQQQQGQGGGHSSSGGPNSAARLLVAHFQQEDLLLFGRLCLALATNSLSAFSQSVDGHGGSLHDYLDLLPRTYSNDLRTLIGYLISAKGGGGGGGGKQGGGGPRSIDDIMPMIGARFYMQLDHLYYRYDHLYEELAKEADNGRLLRLLAKLGTINERPEHQLDPNWSETGDRYMLKLFRDYLFHQVDEEGRPWLDLGHLVTNLTKMDVGSGEKICLVSRDAQNVLIVSFEELKRCFEAAIADLMQ